MIISKEKRENESQFDFHDPDIHSYHIKNRESLQSIVVSLEYRDMQRDDCDIVVERAHKVQLYGEMYNPANKVHAMSSKMSIWQYVQNLLIPVRSEPVSVI